VSVARDTTSSWVRYDEVADGYARLTSLMEYGRLAQDLVVHLALPAGASLLDVGCGTGVALVSARAALGPTATIVGADPSEPMLRRIPGHAAAWRVAAAAPGLPFRDGAFQGVVASLVLSHLEAYPAALRDMVRVLAPGARLGVTAFASGGTRSSRARPVVWDAARSLVNEHELREAFRSTVPWEDRFADPAHLAEALIEAGLAGVEIEQREYEVTIGPDDYVSMVEVFTLGRFLRGRIGPEQWQRFRQTLAEQIAARCGERVEYATRCHLAVGRKGGA
jgi:ubiquinone/menaquinone biosynthesis C-methylase UbiE